MIRFYYFGMIKPWETASVAALVGRAESPAECVDVIGYEIIPLGTLGGIAGGLRGLLAVVVGSVGQTAESLR